MPWLRAGAYTSSSLCARSAHLKALTLCSKWSTAANNLSAPGTQVGVHEAGSRFRSQAPHAAECLSAAGDAPRADRGALGGPGALRNRPRTIDLLGPSTIRTSRRCGRPSGGASQASVTMLFPMCSPGAYRISSAKTSKGARVAGQEDVSAGGLRTERAASSGAIKIGQSRSSATPTLARFTDRSGGR
jgi:hypothetical protein